MADGPDDIEQSAIEGKEMKEPDQESTEPPAQTEDVLETPAEQTNQEAAADEPAPENQEESGEAQADTEGAAFNNEQLENPAQEAGATEPQESEPFQEPTAPSEEALAEALGELPKESEINEQGKTEAPAQDRESPGEATQEPEATQENEAEQETEAATEPEGAQEPQGAQEPEVAHEQEGAQKLESDQEPEGVQEPEGAQEPESAQEPEGAQEPEVAQEPEGAQEPEVAHEQEGAQELESDEEPEGVQEPEGAQELQGAQEPDDTQEPGGAQEPETVPEVKSEKETETSGEQAESAPQEPKAEIADVYDKTEVLETEKLNGEEDPAAELKEAETVEVNDAEKRENEQAEDGEQTETEKKDESPSETDTKVDSEGVASSQQFALQAPTADNAEGVDPISPSKVKLTDAPDSSVTNKTPVQPLPEDMQASARADALSDAQLTTTTGGPSTNEPVEKKPAVNIQGTSRGRLSEAPKEKVAPKPKQRNHCLNLEWVFGVNKFCPALSMLYKMNADDPGRDAVLYTCSNVAVMYSFNENSQILLQGHSHAITCSAVSEDKRWLVTADSGRYASIIVWDTFTAIPVQTIFDPHPGADNMNTDTGVAAITITNDAKYIASISSSFPQEVSIWDWTSQTGAKPVASITLTLSETSNIQTFITFNPQDPSQLVTNGQDQVVFYLWDGAENICYSDPKVTDQDFNRVVGTFSQSVHAPGSKWTFTATSAGNVVVWAPDKILDRQASKAKAASYKLKAFKLVRLQERALTVMTTHDQYVVTGDIVGCIKFYDNQLRMINWYQDFDKIGPINSLSFAYCPGFPFNKTSLSMPTDATIEANKFPIKDFIVSTTTAKVGKVQNDGTQLVMIAEEHDDAVFAMAAHPSRPQLCIGSHSSYLKIWDYLQKKVVCEMRIKPKKKISCLAYDPSGKFIALAFEDGTVRVIDSLTLSDELKQPFAMSKGPITHIQFSHNSKFLVTADKDLCIVVYKAQFVEDAPPFVFFGKNRAHYKEITGIMFGVALESEQPRLMSIGKDRVLVEYDLENSSEDDIKVASTNRIEQSAIPLSVAWYPPVLKEDFLITANDQYKLKLYNSTTKMCRKTVLGPTYGSPVNKVAVLPYIEDPFNEPRYIVFSTNDRVGLHKLPVLGNPHDAMVTVAHPQGIADLCCSFDSTYVFTAGGPDCTVQMWQVYYPAIEASAKLGGEDLIPFYDLLEGGREGAFFKELEDYFYYAMIRSQGVNTMKKRQVSVSIPIAEIPFVMRALGFYPTEQEIEDILNEVKFSNYVTTGKYVTDIDLNTFIKLYVNHRPAFGLNPELIAQSFQHLGVADTQGQYAIDRDEFIEILQNRGEQLNDTELAEFLSILLGASPEGSVSEVKKFKAMEQNPMILNNLPTEITADLFATTLLGFPISEIYKKQFEASEPNVDNSEMQEQETSLSRRTSAKSVKLVTTGSQVE